MRILFAFAAVVLAGCATLEPPAEVPADLPVPALAAVPRSFEMSGRISIRQAERGDIAKLRWVRQGGQDTWIVSSPLGNEVARIEAAASGAELRIPGQPVEQAADFGTLTERLVGVALDPALLARWLHGGSGAASPGDWVVTVEASQRTGAIELARRMTATRGEVVVKLVVDGYRVLEE